MRFRQIEGNGKGFVERAGVHGREFGVLRYI